MFYVYEWYNKETDEIFYVGKGTKKRYLQTTKRNRLFTEYLSKNNCSSRIIKIFETEQEAFEYEHERIVELKAKNQAFANLDYGGCGGVNFIWTEEMRKYKSVHNPMKSEEQRHRMSQKNPMKRAEVQEKVKKAVSKPVIIGGNEYPSLIAASKHFGVCEATIKKWVKKGISPLNEPCRYKGQPQKEYSGRYNKAGCREINYNNKIYESPIDVAKEIGLHNSTICKWAKKGFSPNGVICKYLDDETEYIYKPFINGQSNKKPIMVNGTIYPSKNEAEIALGLSKGYLAPYIAGTRKNKLFICEYVNQQPSHTNSDNSSMEGSTTNG